MAQIADTCGQLQKALLAEQARMDLIDAAYTQVRSESVEGELLPDGVFEVMRVRVISTSLPVVKASEENWLRAALDAEIVRRAELTEES